MKHQKILILDFGSQVTQLIARRVREAHVFCEVQPCDVSDGWIRDYAADGILMNAVDTGWVTDERPHPGKQAQRAAGFRPPLDVIDGAARVYHPIVAAERGEPASGQFFKDYRSVQW